MRRMAVLVPAVLSLALLAGCASGDSTGGSAPAANGAQAASGSGAEAGSGTQTDGEPADAADSGGGSGSR